MARLPDGSFDAVVAYNSLMDVADMPAAVAEAARALEDAGLLIERLREPPAPAALAARPGYERWQRLPNFLHLRAIKAA